ncbi:Histidine ammonia-lyase [hydrothermal vent metagenome]|uniref:histidine ammonia-lyase n=1 Tax=hydrothermal vent metagenome TaxID=652676 RepID=A0A3B1CDR6_9ZZZZ
MTKVLKISGDKLSLSDFYAVVLEHRPVHFSEVAEKKMNRSRRLVGKILSEGEAVYGVNTGFGKLARERISNSEIQQLQVNLIRSHACGAGPPLSEAAVRGMLLLRAQVLAMGHSGVRPLIVARLVEILNCNLYPFIPSRGSVGACGDLIPLAHLALLLLGEGEAFFEGERLPGAQALKRAGIQPVTLEAKEGLSLVNGTQAALSLGLLALHRAERLAETANLAGAMSLEALMGTPTAFDEKLQNLRPHPGQLAVAKKIRTLLEDSEIRDSHVACDRIQDPYSIRCIPQVHGAVCDAIGFVKNTLLIEMRSVTDNPIVFPEDGEILSGGNFHGHPVALSLDFLAVALTHLGVISERRIAQLIDPECIDLPPFLTRRPGLNSGLMMPQVAAAALASECKVLAHPASVDSIPTSVNQEDYVSMAMGAALKLQQITQNISDILAIELFSAAEGVAFHAPLKAGHGVEVGITKLRAEVLPLDEDRSLQKDFEKISKMILDGVFCV